MAAFTIAALTSEITNDPKAVGYQALLTAKDFGAIAQRINDPANVAGKGNVAREPITAIQFLTQLVDTEASTFTAAQWSALNFAFCGGSGTVNLGDVATQMVLIKSLGTAAATITALTAYLNRVGSRAEVLWGTGAVVTLQNIHDATGQ
jgi:hypothetical protein